MLNVRITARTKKKNNHQTTKPFEKHLNARIHADFVISKTNVRIFENALGMQLII